MTKNQDTFFNAATQGPDFLVITNFSYNQNPRTGAPINIYSGLSEESFAFMVAESAKDNDASVYYIDGNTVILRGWQSDLRKIETDCGERFSYAYCSEESAQKTIERCREAAYETPEDRELMGAPQTENRVQHLN